MFLSLSQCLSHVCRFSSRGELVSSYQFPVSKVTSLCFGGPTMSDLFITSASKRVNARTRTIGRSDISYSFMMPLIKLNVTMISTSMMIKVKWVLFVVVIVVVVVVRCISWKDTFINWSITSARRRTINNNMDWWEWLSIVVLVLVSVLISVLLWLAVTVVVFVLRVEVDSSVSEFVFLHVDPS